MQRHYRKGKNLGIAISGSGETLAVNKYIDDIITMGGEIKLITANENGTAYKMVSEYERGSVLLFTARTKQSTDKDTRSRLSPMGTEFDTNRPFGGPHRRIAVCFVEWSGIAAQKVVIDWTLIGDIGAARRFSDQLLEAPRSFADRTSISGAIDFAAALFIVRRTI